MPLSQTRIQERLKEKFGDRSSRTGGKGAVRRKYKAPAKTATQDDKRLNSQLKRLNVTQIPAIEEVNLFKDDGTVVHFTKPKVQAEIASNTYVIQGDHATKKLEELFPDILPQLGGESIEKLKNLAQVLQKANFGADQVPNLVDENFEEVAKRDEKEETAEKSGDKPAVQNTEEKKEIPVVSNDAGNTAASTTAPTTDTNATSSTTNANTTNTDANKEKESTTTETKPEPKTLEPDANQTETV